MLIMQVTILEYEPNNGVRIEASCEDPSTGSELELLVGRRVQDAIYASMAAVSKKAFMAEADTREQAEAMIKIQKDLDPDTLFEGKSPKDDLKS